MPRIALEEALFLVTVLVQVGMAPGSTRSVTSYDDEDGNRAEEGPTLYERCAEAAVRAVRHAVQRSPSSLSTSPKNDFSRNNVEADYQALPIEVEVDLLERVLLRHKAVAQNILTLLLFFPVDRVEKKPNA